ncbi:MAG TPA: YkgJ family cysteine cluster protein [Blastocatellia bacterium]|nr:YkgJ family cysteine cluster protein [Blastocatellia bacterium]
MNNAHMNMAKVEAQATLPILVQLTRKRGMSEAAFVEMMEQLSRRRAMSIAADEEVGLYAETLAESVIAIAEAGRPDCQTCGACCAYFHQVAVLDSDPTPRRLTWAVWDAGAVKGPKTRWLRREPGEGHCVAFDGRVGQRAHCAVYELRPMSCRAFEAGSDRCHAVRRVYGLEPPLSPCERSAHAGRINLDIGGEWNEAESLERRNAPSFGGRERAKLLGEMIAYNRAMLTDISTEAQRLWSLLAGKGITLPTEIAARHAEAINKEAEAVSLAIARLTVTECTDSCDEAETEKLNGDLLKVAVQSLAALKRASRWLLALGELVFTTFEMRVETAPAEVTDKNGEADPILPRRSSRK